MNKSDKILITGGSGFIGTNLVKFLLEKTNSKIFNIDKISYCSVPERFKDYINNNNYNFVKHDLTNLKKSRDLFNTIEPNYVINLASESHVDRSIDDPVNFVNNNNSIILNVLESLRNKKFLKKIINISTDEVYGGENDKPATENNKIITNSPYSASKGFGDLISNAFFKTYNVPIINVHCCNNFGPYQFTEKFIPRSLYAIFTNSPIEIYGNGKNIREWIFVKDFCNALFLILKKGNIGENYNIGSNNRLNNQKLIQKIIKSHRKIFPNEIKSFQINHVKDRPGHDFKYAINSNKIRKELNWFNEFSLDKGLDKTLRWYFDQKSWLSYCLKKYNGSRLGKLK